MELLRDLPAGVALLVLCWVFRHKEQIRVNQTGNTAPGETLLHLSTEGKWNTHNAASYCFRFSSSWCQSSQIFRLITFFPVSQRMVLFSGRFKAVWGEKGLQSHVVWYQCAESHDAFMVKWFQPLFLDLWTAYTAEHCICCILNGTNWWTFAVNQPVLMRQKSI